MISVRTSTALVVELGRFGLYDVAVSLYTDRS